jgi:hypothetical protein
MHRRPDITRSETGCTYHPPFLAETPTSPAHRRKRFKGCHGRGPEGNGPPAPEAAALTAKRLRGAIEPSNLGVYELEELELRVLDSGVHEGVDRRLVRSHTRVHGYLERISRTDIQGVRFGYPFHVYPFDSEEPILNELRKISLTSGVYGYAGMSTALHTYPQRPGGGCSRCNETITRNLSLACI